MLLGMLLVPSSLKAKTKTTTIDLAWAGTCSYFHAAEPNNTKYNFSITMSNTSYSGISGAKVGDNVVGKNSTTQTIDISRLAFIYNSNVAGNALHGKDSNNNPWGQNYHFTRDADKTVKQSGLYSGSWENYLAILKLIPSDKVTIYYAGATTCDGNANIHVENADGYGWGTQLSSGGTASMTVNINFVGDLKIKANPGTLITSIVIESSIAEYVVDEDPVNKRSTFEFTAPGMMEENDVAVDFMKVTFGNINDLLIVNNDGGNLQSTMYNSETGSENLVTGGHNFQPSGGNFYAFRPTASGSITIEGGMHGNCIHLFIYDIKEDGWVKDGNNFYHDTYNQNDSHWHSITFPVNKGRIYYICQDNTKQAEVNGNYAFHLHKFIYNRTFNIENLGVVIDNVDSQPNQISLTRIENPGGTEGQSVTVKRCTGNISPNINCGIQGDWIYMDKPTFADGTDHAGTVILDVVTENGEGTVVVTFPYHANFGVDPTNPNRTLGHTWNFIDPRNSDSNFGNCWYYNQGQSSYVKGTTSGILSIGQWWNTNSQFRHETDNREWTWSRRVQGTNGTIHDPYYMNVFDMVGDNADMIWETEGLIFNTETNLSIIYNESDPYTNPDVTNPLNFNLGLTYDPDRYVGLLPDAEHSSFTIPSLKDGDRVLIFMKSGIKMSDDDADHGIFLNIHGAKDAIGKPIVASDLYKAGGTNYIGGSSHTRYEGCYHFIKDGDGDMTFDMVGGSMCKLMYVRIYSGERISTNGLLSNKTENGQTVGGNLLFMNDKGATTGDGARLTLHYTGKVQHSAFEVLTCSGNLNKNDNSFKGDNFKQSGTYEQFLDFTSTVGKIGMFRLRAKDLEYNKEYVADFVDRNFTVGYRDKVDSYPYTWDFTDIQGYSSDAMSDEDEDYSAANGLGELDPANAAGYEISLFDANGYMKVNSGVNPEDCNHIFDPHKIGFGNQLWAGGGVIPETRGLWFYRDESDDEHLYYNSALYNDCVQITSEGLCFVNAPDAEGKRVPWWNMKMVVPDVPANAAVYLRMKRDSRVKDSDKMFSTIDNDYVLFLNTRFHFGTNPKTSLTKDGQNVYLTQENGSNYSFYQVPGTTDEYILAIKNTTGATNHLTYTLNGWIVKKLAVSEYSKNIGSTGFATESRNDVIDHTLTGYLSGLPVKGYIVTGLGETLDNDNRAILVEDAGVLPAGQGCFLANDMTAEYDANADKSVKTLNDCTYLFAPDMHDSPKTVTSNLMVAKIDGGYIPAVENGKTNYALSNKHFSPSNPAGTTVYGKVGFFRITGSGIQNAHENSAYLQIPTSTANGVKAFYIALEGAEDPLAEDLLKTLATRISQP